MVKIIDHQQTGKRKFIKGPGKKRDIPLELLDGTKNLYEVKADRFIEKTKNQDIKKEKINFYKPNEYQIKQKTKEKVEKKIIKKTRKLKQSLSNCISNINYLFRHKQLSNNDTHNAVKELKIIMRKI